MNRHSLRPIATGGLCFAAVLVLQSAPARAADRPPSDRRVECLRRLLPITALSRLQSKRAGIDPPLALGSGHVAFPQTSGRHVTGFFIYGPGAARHYDKVAWSDSELERVADLLPTPDRGVLDLVAQPDGMETVVIPFLPGLSFSDGRSFGAVYRSPQDAKDSEIARVISGTGRGERSPASGGGNAVRRTVVRLVESDLKGEQVWAPIERELKLRYDWIRNHNIDESTFKDLASVMTKCR